MRITIFRDQLLVTQGLFEWIEIGALYVFDDGDLQRRLVIHVPDNNRDLDQPSQLGGAPASLAGDDLVSVAVHRPHDDRLHDTVLSNGAGEIVQFGIIEETTGIARIAADELDRDHSISTDRPLGFHRNRLIHFTNQRRKAAAQSPFRYIVIHGHHRSQ